MPNCGSLVLIMDKKCELRVNMLQASALFYLEEKKSAQTREIEDQLNLDSSMTSFMLDPLIKAEIVKENSGKLELASIGSVVNSSLVDLLIT